MYRFGIEELSAPIPSTKVEGLESIATIATRRAINYAVEKDDTLWTWDTSEYSCPNVDEAFFGSKIG